MPKQPPSLESRMTTLESRRCFQGFHTAHIHDLNAIIVVGSGERTVLPVAAIHLLNGCGPKASHR